jgi:hypothetical protein
VTINGDTQTVIITGDLNVTNTVDTLTLNASTTVFPGAKLTLTTLPYTATGGVGAEFDFNVQGTLSVVPEPASLTSLGLGGVCLLAYGWRRRPASRT